MAIDFQFDETADNRPIKILNVTDEFTSETLTTNAARCITAARTRGVSDQIDKMHGTPQLLRMDNGSEFIADTLRDWCKEQHITANYCDPGSPGQNGRIESFNSRPKDELLNREVFHSMWEIRFMLKEHRNNYNHYRPQSAISYLTPIEFTTK